jgi:hypothetical protein
MLSIRARRPLLALVGLTLAGSLLGACRSHDPRKELEIEDVETYWVVDSPREGENFIAPAVRFRLVNRTGEELGSVQARARFPGTAEEEPWGSIQEQVSTWRQPLRPGQSAVVVVRSIGRYHASADPEDMFRSPEFRDPRAEVYVRIGSSSWARLAEAEVVRRIGAPGVEELLAP